MTLGGDIVTQCSARLAGRGLCANTASSILSLQADQNSSVCVSPQAISFCNKKTSHLKFFMLKNILCLYWAEEEDFSSFTLWLLRVGKLTIVKCAWENHHQDHVRLQELLLNEVLHIWMIPTGEHFNCDGDWKLL